MENEFFMSAGIPSPTLFDPSSSSAMPSWQALSSAMEIQTSQFNSTVEQSSSECFFSPNWEKLTDQNVQFDSGLSSMVSSPAASNNNISHENFVIRELIGKVGHVGNSGEISPHSHQPFQGTPSAYICTNNSANNSCYSTPLNSPPKVNLPMKENFPKLPNSIPLNSTLAEFSADPGFAERAAKFSCFGSRSFNGRTSQYRMKNAELPYGSNSLMENGKLSRVLSSHSIKALGSQLGVQEKRSSNPPLQGRTKLASSREESQVSKQNPKEELDSLDGESNSRKRKAISRGKGKEQPVSAPSTPASKVAETNDESAAKRRKPNEGNKKNDALVKAGEEKKGNSATAAEEKQTKTNQKPHEPPMDYIHVRARRGQATDSHSLAERVRREKISERMKLLQDLVPGCNKVTGKALMLDEIINYVQSLQRQVEFLSMKLSSVNTRLDSNVNTLVTKNTYQPNNLMPHAMFPIDSSTSAFYSHQSQQYPSSNISSATVTQCSINPLDSTLCHNLGMQLPPLNGFNEVVHQFPTFCEDDLQTIVQMGFGKDPNQDAALQSQSLEGSSQVQQMKVEL